MKKGVVELKIEGEKAVERGRRGEADGEWGEKALERRRE